MTRCAPLRFASNRTRSVVLQGADGTVARKLECLRANARVDERVSPVRVLDVVIGMRHKDEHTRSRCQGLAL